LSNKKLENLRQRKEALLLGGGQKAIDKQHSQGKLTARERIEALLDPNSFVELDPFAQHRCTNFGMEKKKVDGDGVVTGYGTVNGRLVYVFSQDFTVIGGSLGLMHAKKIVHCQKAALKVGAPLIGINDSGGARIQEGVDALAGYGEIFFNSSIASGVIPQISIIVGPCAGGATYSPALTDFIFMVQGVGQMFITGPQVIATVTGEKVSAEELGGAMAHNKTSGVAHFYDESEQACFDRVRDLLSYLPQNNLEVPAAAPALMDPNTLLPQLDELIPESANRAYDMMSLITALADGGKFLEYQPYFAPNMICGFMRLNGRSVGVIANQPKVQAGCLDINASDKSSRFIRTCDSFNVPILTLVDVPGFLPGTAQEFGGIIRHGAKMLYSYSEATVPKVTVITRKAYGGSYLAMCSKDLGADMVLAWPTAEIAVMGPDGAANIIFRKDIEGAEDPVAMKKQKTAEYTEMAATPYVAAGFGYIDDVIEPNQTRQRLISAFDMLSGKREDRPAKKHGNIPL